VGFEKSGKWVKNRRSLLGRLFFGMGVLSLVVLGTTGLHARGQLNIMCSWSQGTCDQVASAFEAQTGVKVNMFRLSTGEAYARLHAEERNPKNDVWYGGTAEPHIQASDEDLTLSYRSPNVDNLHSWAYKLAESTDFKTSGIGGGILGFTWRTDGLAAKNLPEPKCWADLLKKDYAQEIAVSNPNTAGTGYSVVANLTNLKGEDEAFDYLKQLNGNVVAYNKTGGAAIMSVSRGEVLIGVGFLHDVPILLQQGFPMKYSPPCEGTGISIDAMSIVKGARNLDEAKRFVDWALTAEAQSMINLGGFYVTPSVKGTKISEHSFDVSSFPIIDFDLKLYGSSEKRKQLLTRWDKEIGIFAGQQ